MESDWTVRRRTCTTIYTHKDRPFQIIHHHSTDEILYRTFYFESVEKAKEFAENDTTTKGWDI